MDETVTQKILHALVFLGICASIVSIGWKEPLRYRFMSPEEISAIENPMPEFVPPPPPQPDWMTDPRRRTLLDGPTRTAPGSIKRGAPDNPGGRH